MVDLELKDRDRFADLKSPYRIWVIAAIHGTRAPLISIHQAVAARFQVGDRIVYLGNFLGYGKEIIEVVNEILQFRLAVMAVPGVIASDLVYLRGCQEEMWQKIQQLHFAPNPQAVLEWMARQGAAATLAAYGGSYDEAVAAARDGAVTLSRWTARLRGQLRLHPGHESLLTVLRRAAFVLPADPSPDADPTGLLMVSAGLDRRRALGAQGDSFWWAADRFDELTSPYGRFGRIVRGFDPAGNGVRETAVTLTLDGGCGFGGRLVCACLGPTGTVIELLGS